MGQGPLPPMFLWNPSTSAGPPRTRCRDGQRQDRRLGRTLPQNGVTYTVTEAGDKGTEIIIGPPFEFNADNIEDWKTVY